MRILVTGATGTIGTVLTDTLAAAGHDVRGLAHTDATAAALAARGVGVARGDLTDPAGLAALADDVDAVVWAATTNDGALDRAAIEAVLGRLEGTGRTFLYISGAWVHGDTHGTVADESSPLDPTPLVGWRPAVEERVLGTRGVRGLVVRPGIVYGRGIGIPAMLVATARAKGVARTIGDGDNRWPVVAVADLADLVRRALEQAPGGSVFLAVEEPPVRQRDVMAAVGRAAGVDVAPWPLPEARAELGAFADALALDQHLSSRRARERLGWRPRGHGLVAALDARF